MRSRWTLPIATALLVAWVTPAWAGPIYGFVGVTNNNAADLQTGRAQLTVQIDDEGFNLSTLANQVSFTFRNSGPNASSITDIYFDDGSLLGIASVTGGSGVDFSQGASPGDLPGGNAIDFHTSAGFNADSNPPTQPNGVNPGEYVKIVFNVIAGQTYADTIHAVNLSLANPGTDMEGGLRIGIHVQGFAGGGSESFVMAPLPPVIFGGSMLMGLVAMKRRSRA